MGALNPTLLFAAALVAVPVLLHLLHRRDADTFVFPALRYLVRTERDRSRRIRLRQLILLALRAAVVLVLALAAARLYLRSGTGGHPPTAVALVIDNSLSSGLVRGEDRVLDGLVDLARVTLDLAGEDDRFWMIRAGEPWMPATPLRAREAVAELANIRPSDARGDARAALAKARALLEETEFAHREIHFLSDMQATAFDADAPPESEEAGSGPEARIPLIAPAPPEAAGDNRGVVSVVVGGGAAPVVGTRAEVAVTAGPGVGGKETQVRVATADRVRGVLDLTPGAAGRIELPRTAAGWTSGYAEIEPDRLRADDRRYFVFEAAPPTTVATAGPVGMFVAEALAVLGEAGRISRSPPDGADLLVSADGVPGRVNGNGATLVLPPADAARLPALNRRLVGMGIGWRLERRALTGGAALEGMKLPEPLDGTRVDRAYGLVPVEGADDPGRVLAELAGEAWAVEGRDNRGGRFLLLASPLDERSTSLPVSAGMVPFFNWIVGQWTRRGADGGRFAKRLAGEPLPTPPGVTAVRLPSGRIRPVDGARTLRETGEAGLYAFLIGGAEVPVSDSTAPEVSGGGGTNPGGTNSVASASSAVSVGGDPGAELLHSWAAVVPDPRESDLTPLSEDDVRDLAGVEIAGDAQEWADLVFRSRRGPELWRLLLGAGLILLVLEGLVAASTARGGRSG